VDFDRARAVSVHRLNGQEYVMSGTRIIVCTTCVAALALSAWSGGCARSAPGGSWGETAGAEEAGAPVGSNLEGGTIVDSPPEGGPSDPTEASSGQSPTLIDNADGASSPVCTDLKCRVRACPGGASTSISGTVYDPAGKNPLYDVVVYVPNAPLDPLTPGASCYSCRDLYSGHPIATALTDPLGHFTIPNAPDGSNVPLVVQIGKWRRQFSIPSVTACTDNAQPDRSLRLPRSRQEGDLPSIAISTGGADTLECLLGRIGVDSSEYGGGAGATGRIHVFQGGGGAPNTSPPAPTSASSLWISSGNLLAYDIVLLSCEGDETAGMNQQALFDYTSAGGRVFASHFHYAWFNSGPFGAANLATWTAGANPIGNVSASIVTTLNNGQPFPKGRALEQWLGNVNALTNGKLPILAARHNADVGAASVASQPWIVADQNANAPGATQYFTFDTPLGVAPDKQCGRVVFSDLHVGAASGDYGTAGVSGGNAVVPSGCATNDLSPQEKALEFMLFDLSSCLTPDSQPPQPPPPLN
jgi:hypothetical protein